MADEPAGTFRTVAERAAARFEVRGSEFVGHVAPVGSMEAAESFVAAVREEHPEATHVVPAYRVPAGEASAGRPAERRLREWSSDDGEPAGSAGKPALNVLQGRELRNVAAAVVRHYGGVELGVGGLARAYGRAVKGAVDAAGVVERRPHERFEAAVDYDDSGTVRGVLESAGVAFDADYGERVVFDVEVPVDEAAALRDRLRSATSGRVELT
ncbi:MAG: YigZ family protein [Haloferacaceae archaeon]